METELDSKNEKKKRNEIHNIGKGNSNRIKHWTLSYRFNILTYSVSNTNK